MATNLAVIYAAMQANGILQNKIEAQVVIEAGKIQTEAPEVENHANRLIWANKVLSVDNATFIPTTSRLLLLLALGLNATAQAKGNTLTDGEIEFILRTELLTSAVIVAILNA